MPEDKKETTKKGTTPDSKGKKEEKKENKAPAPKKGAGKSVYGEKRKAFKGRRRQSRGDQPQDEFEQRIVDLARVTRVMAGGKRMRFRACVAIGNRKGKVGLGMDKGADVSIAVNKAVASAKKNIVDVPMVNDTIPHEIFFKTGAAKILLKPARKGKGVIAGGSARIVLELSGIKNITSKILGTNNNVNVAKSALGALANIKKIDKPKKENKKKESARQANGKKNREEKEKKSANK